MLKLARLIPLLLVVAFVGWCSHNRSSPDPAAQSLNAELMDRFATSGLIDGPLPRGEQLPQLAKRVGPSGMNRLLYDAIDSASVPVIQWMIDHGADVQNIGVIEREPLLHRAAKRPQYDRLEYLLSLGLDPLRRSADGQTVMHVAAANGMDERTLALLLKTGLKTSDATTTGRQPIHFADTKSIAALAAAGADLSVQDNQGRSALHWAALERRNDAVTELLRLNASVFVTDKQGRTPLHLAALSRADAVVDSLLTANAPKAARDNDGFTPRELAESSRRRSSRDETAPVRFIDKL